MSCKYVTAFCTGCLFSQSIQSFICSEQYKKQVNAQYSVQQDTLLLNGLLLLNNELIKRSFSLMAGLH